MPTPANTSLVLTEDELAYCAANGGKSAAIHEALRRMMAGGQPATAPPYTVRETLSGLELRIPGGLIMVSSIRPATTVTVIDQDRYTLHGVEYGARKGAVVTLLGPKVDQEK